LNRFDLLLSHQTPSIAHLLIWCFVWQDGGRTQWTFASFEHWLAHKMLESAAHAMTLVRY